MSTAILKTGLSLGKLVNYTAPKAVVDLSSKITSFNPQGVIKTMVENFGRALGFGGKVIAESPVTTLLTTESTKNISINKLAALTSIGVSVGVTATAAANTLRHSRTDMLIQTRSGAYMTDQTTNNNLRNVSTATAGIGLVAGAQGASQLAGEALIQTGQGSSAAGSVLSSIGNATKTALNTVTGTTGFIGDAIKPGLGKLTGSPLALMLTGLVAHWGINEYYLKMPQGNSFLNSLGWGGSKSFLVVDRTDPNFLQPLGRQGLMDSINNDTVNGTGRAAPTSEFWDIATG